MSILIEIDRKTIKRNPSAGQTAYKNIVGIRHEVKHFDGRVTHNYSPKNIMFKTINTIPYLVLEMQDGQKMTLKADGNLYCDTYYDYETVYTLSPAPAYTYEFKNTSIECDTCGKQFLHSELISDSFYDTHSDKICPYCQAWACCDIKYENINNIDKEEIKQCLQNNS